MTDRQLTSHLENNDEKLKLKTLRD